MDFLMETRDLTKAWRKKTAVERVNLHVREGEIYGFVGPNGAGKSTVMKMMMNLIHPDAGEARIFGERMGDESYESFKRIGSIIEAPCFYEKMTGRENLELYCEYMGYHNRERIEEALSEVGLSDIDQKSVSHFSMGMKQRLAIARAILTRPELLILDEPTNGLDPAGIQEIRELICELPKRMGITVLVSSHLLSEMDQMADYVGIINHGQLIFQNKLDVLHEHSKSKLLLQVMNRTVTLKILESRGVEGRVTEEGILIPGFSDDRTADLVSALAAGGAGLFRVEERQKSLEDIFLSLTGRRESL